MLLPAAGIDCLAEIASAEEDADGNHGDAEVGGGLQVIACQNPEASRVEGQLGLQAVFGAQVDDRTG